MQSGRAGGETYRMLRVNPRGESFFELRNLGPGRQPIGTQHFDHGLDIGLCHRLPPIRQQSFAHRGSTIDGKRLHADERCGHKDVLMRIAVRQIMRESFPQPAALREPAVRSTAVDRDHSAREYWYRSRSENLRPAPARSSNFLAATKGAPAE